MTLITLNDIHRRFGDFEILTGSSLQVEERDRVGVVGDNGAGKTTLIRILAGVDEADDGTRSARRGLRIAYAQQIPQLEPGVDVLSFVQRGNGEFGTLESKIRELEHALADAPGDERALAEYGALAGAFEAAGGYEHDHLCERVLSGLGVPEPDWSKDLDVLSGGEKSRVVLAALMTAPADLLILDEPTNHLDLQGIQFVEGYVQRHPGAVLVVSHDRSFLDSVSSRIVEVQDGRTASYKGNYSAFRTQKDQQLLAEARAHKNQQAYVAKEMDYIRRNMAGRMHRQAKGRLKRLQRLERLTTPKKQQRGIALTFRGEVRGQSGQTIIEAHDLVLRLPNGRVLVDGASFRIHHGETVGLVGRNGCGKTTLMNALSGVRSLEGGKIDVAHGVRIGKFHQEVTHLPQDLAVLDALRQVDAAATDGELRDHLALFLFTGDEVETRVRDLSGGEKQRLSLARLTRSNDYDVLCLDEPTNHLDISGREGLERALNEFPGSSIVISHDRKLLEAVTDRILYLEEGAVRSFRGGLVECMAQIAAERQARRAAESAARDKQKHRERADNPEPAPTRSSKIRNPLLFEKLEEEIFDLEAGLEEIRRAMTEEENYRDPARMKDLQTRERDLGAKLAGCYERWENWA